MVKFAGPIPIRLYSSGKKARFENSSKLVRDILATSECGIGRETYPFGLCGLEVTETALNGLNPSTFQEGPEGGSSLLETILHTPNKIITVFSVPTNVQP